MHPLTDELQGLLTRLMGRAREREAPGIYRGEPECFPRISSGLYRQLHEIGDPHFDIGSAQQRLIELARRYEPHLSDVDVLTRLQHQGGRTNLVDFTRDLNIALYFASSSSPGRDGRVIFMEEPPVLRERGEVLAPVRLVVGGSPAGMTDLQKSLWVEPARGYIDEESVDVAIVVIPSTLKPEILSHLRVVYGIEAATVYRDLSGLIRDQDRLRDREAEWHAGVRAREAGDHERALRFSNRYEALDRAPRWDLPYYRGISYWYAGRREEALADMADFRSRSPGDHRAFPEEMESAFTARRRGRGTGGGRRADPGAGTAGTAFAVFGVRLVADAAVPYQTRVRIARDSRSSSEQMLRQKETFVSFPGLTPAAGQLWLLSLERHGYRPVDSRPMRWPVRETFVLEAIEGDAPDVIVEVESLRYAIEPDVEGPVVTYPARGDGESDGDGQRSP